MEDKNIKLVRSCRWEEVFVWWYLNEGKESQWQELARKKGFDSWAEWRLTACADKFDCSSIRWGLYEVADPSLVVENWFGGPFSTWQEKYYDGAYTRTFKELAARHDIGESKGVRNIINNYPESSVVIALELLDGKIVVVEGMHRSCALARMAYEGSPFKKKLFFAIGKSNLKCLLKTDKNYEFKKS